MKNIFSKIWYIVIAVVVVLVSFLFFLIEYFNKNDFVVSPLGTEVPSQVIVKPFDKYRVLDLANYVPKAANYVIEKTLEDNLEFTSYLVSFYSDGKKVTGMVNVPKVEGPFQVIVMFRGYVDPEIYYTGLGSQKAGEVFAKNGYITFAPDFLGYAGSDKEAENIFESRFQTYTTALDSLEIAKDIPNSIPGKVGIWAHSNGGQITLTVLEATQKEYPTILWAPVTKPFPYSILYYTDEAEDRGKFLRKELAKFEADYNVDEFAIADYVDRIKAPIQFHQGGADESVPQKWSDEFVKSAKDSGVDIKYFTYPGSDHNLTPAWNTVVQRDLTFINSFLK
ncbi:dienelactone hydrolase family protein [Candidatus Gottesmanbacteria bacterium]|nr:dienelactone hydrolase family protein [Candidatus Gottesmanbacteria bacterium]